jgi:hypothetical protein
MNNGKSIRGRPIQIGSSTSAQCVDSRAASDRTPHHIRMRGTGFPGLRRLPRGGGSPVTA